MRTFFEVCGVPTLLLLPPNRGSGEGLAPFGDLPPAFLRRAGGDADRKLGAIVGFLLATLRLLQ
jgi:hypothetical protein